MSKIIDFGIAKAANNLARTQLGMLKGKVTYASPEQCRCEQVDRRSDVFSLGVLLFELSTGRVLFPQNNQLAVMKAITEGAIPRPSEIDPTYPSALERIVLRALARKRSERYATAQDLKRDLECFAREHRSLQPLFLVARAVAGDPLSRRCQRMEDGARGRHHSRATHRPESRHGARPSSGGSGSRWGRRRERRTRSSRTGSPESNGRRISRRPYRREIPYRTRQRA